MTDYFDSHSYYRFHHKARPDETLYITDGDGDVDMGQFNTSSSENWQIYYQQGRWFIRPYATSVELAWTDFQLSLTKDDKGNVGALPNLARRSGELGQQWTFAQVDDGNGGFGYTISNALLGNTSFLALTGDGGQPGMQSSSEGIAWDMQVNRQAGNPGASNSYEDVDNLEVATSSSMSLALSTPAPTASPTSKPTLSSTSIATHTATASSSSSLGSGAIAGIAVGAALVILAAAGAYIYFSKRQRRNTSKETHRALEVGRDAKTTYAQMNSPVEIGGEPVVHIAQERGFQEERYELGNDALSARSVSRSLSVSVHEGSAAEDGVNGTGSGETSPVARRRGNVIS